MAQTLNLFRSAIRAMVHPILMLTGLRIKVQGCSMEPTYREGTRLWVSRLHYWFRRPSRGDVVVVRSLDGRRLELKRVVGLPGERVVWTVSSLKVNGVDLDEPYAKVSAVPGDDEVAEWLLGGREYFVLGDNRLRSRDSRIYGPVDRGRIVGKVLSLLRKK